MWGNSTLFHQVKAIEKDIEKKINIDSINWEILFDRYSINMWPQIM